MQQLILSGSAFAYEARWVDNAQGSLLFVHGSGGDHHVWEGQMQQLPQHFSGVAIDLPGHAASAGPILASIDAGARLLSELPALLNLPRPLWLVGHSMGAAMAISAALDYERQFDGLILIGAGSRLRVLPAILEALRAGKLDPAFLRVSFSPATPAAIFKKELIAFQQVTAAVLYNDFTACDHFDRSADVARIKLPTLVTVGEDDKLTPLNYAQQIQDHIAGSQLIVIPQAGHYVMLEKPDEVNQAIAAFVGSANR